MIMRVLIFQPDAPARLLRLDGGAAGMRAALGGPMELIRMDGGLLLVARADGDRMFPNRRVLTAFSGVQMVRGPFAVCGRDGQGGPEDLPMLLLGQAIRMVQPFPGPPRCIVCGRLAELPEIHGVHCCRRHIAGFLRDWTAETPGW